VYAYYCTLQNLRQRKGFRYGIYIDCEENLAFRKSDDENPGITCAGMDVRVSVMFYSKEYQLKFQTKMNKYNKKSRVEGDPQAIRLVDEHLYDLTIPNLNVLERILTQQYDHDEDSENNSPPFTVDEFTDVHSTTSSSVQHAQNPKTNPEITLVMIESPDSDQFDEQIAERCHLDPKSEDENNFLYMSRLVHAHFDGIDCLNKNIPSILIHYVRHNPTPEPSPVPHIVAERTTVQIFTYNDNFFDSFVRRLKNGGQIVTVNGKRSYQLDLFFKDASKASGFLKWKEKHTTKKWKDNYPESTCDFLDEFVNDTNMTSV